MPLPVPRRPPATGRPTPEGDILLPLLHPRPDAPTRSRPDGRRPAPRTRRILRRLTPRLAAAGTLLAAAALAAPSATGVAAAQSAGPTVQGAPTTVAIQSTHTGYLEVTDAGNVFTHHTPFYGSLAGRHLPAPVVDVAVDPNTGGYWLVTSAGNVYNFHAPWFGSAVGRHPGSPVVGITATRTGYLLATAAGNVYNFHTPWYGSQAGKRLPGPVADITVDPYTNGYWLATSAGNVYNFHAPWYGSPVAAVGEDAVTGIVGTPSGYLVTTTAGNVFNYHTPFHGSEASKSLPSPFADITADPNVHGAYWVAAENGGVYSFDAPALGAHLTADAHRCTAAELHVGEGSTHGAAGNSAVSLRFTNTSGQPCTLTGYPGVAGLDSSGRQVLQARRTRFGPMGGIGPGPIPTVVLGPAQSAAAILEGGDNPAPGVTCPRLSAILVTAPNTGRSVRLAKMPGDCGGMQVHPVIRGTSGVTVP